MAEQIIDQFIAALGQLEAERELEPLVALFAEDCEVGNVLTKDKLQGRDGAQEFWKNYRDTFGAVRSTFRNRIIADAHAALEWTTAGSAKGGDQIEYSGVSILEIEGDKISRFHAYFAPQELGEQISAA